MPVPASTPAAAWLGAAFFVLLALAVYGVQVHRIRRDGGQVRVGEFDLPELFMSFVFAGFFALTVLLSVQRHKHEPAVKIDAVLPNSLLFILFTIGIAGFIRYRGVHLRPLFGLDRLSSLQIAGWSCGLLLAAFPLAFAANALTLLASPGKLDPQPLVDLFARVVQNHDVPAMTKILLSAVLIQPACEEFLFRGFFYGVWKRYLGPVSAGFLACLLFAGFHGSLSAFAGLFALAVCLNIAYERTGSLLVPIGMHALFNFTSLLVIYTQVQNLPASP